MECAEQAHLQDYLDAELAPAAAGDLAAHVRRCYRCAEELRVQQTVFECLDSLPRHTAPPDFTAAILARLPAPPKRTEPRRRVNSAGLVVAALAAALGLWSASLPAGFESAALGRLATAWYAWCGDLAGALSQLQSLSWTELQPLAVSSWRAARALGAALAPQLVAFWVAIYGLGLALQARPRPHRHSVLPS